MFLIQKLTDAHQFFQSSIAEIQELETEIPGLETEIQGLETEIPGLETEIQGLIQRVSIDDVSESGPTLFNAKSLIQALTTSKQAIITTKQATITTKQAIITSIQNQIRSIPNQIKRIQALITSKQHQIRSIPNQIECIQDRMRSKQENVLLSIKTILLQHYIIRQNLRNLVGLGNENTITQTCSQSSSQSNISSCDSRIDATIGASPPRHEKMCLPEKNAGFQNFLIQLVSEDKKTILKTFQKFVIDLFKVAEECKYGTNEGDISVKQTIQAILEWEENTELLEEHTTTIPYARPSTAHDNETKVDQPIFQAVICRIIKILIEPCKQEEVKVLNDHEYGITTEKTLFNIEDANKSDPSCQHKKRSRRRIDITTQNQEEFLKVMPQIMLQTPIEIKVASDDATKFQKAVEKGKAKIIGHLSKRLQHDFDFGGIGRNASAVGVSLNLVSIEAIKMSLSGVGTDKACIETISTGCVPFLGNEFLTDKHNAVVDRDTESNGFILLAGVLMHNIRIQDQFSEQSVSRVQDSNQAHEEDWTEMNYLGSGAFSNVYKVGEGKFLKISRAVSLEKCLGFELRILKKLNASENDCIPQLPKSFEPLVQIQAVVRGEISTMKGLRLNGIIGKPLHNIMRYEWTKNRGKIIDAVYEALQYAHNKSIYHLDVRPGNIIADVTNENMCRVMLSDWGCSVRLTRKNEKMKHFRGSTPYAHDGFLGKTPSFTVNQEIDFASLAYTIDHVEQGKLRWGFEFDRPMNVTDQDKKKRRTFVTEFLNNDCDFISTKIVEDFKKACKIDVTLRRSKRLIASRAQK